MDAETTDIKEGEDSVSGAKVEHDQYDDTTSSKSLNKDSCSPVNPVMLLGPTTQANDSFQTGQRSVPPETDSPQSPKKLNIATDELDELCTRNDNSRAKLSNDKITRNNNDEKTTEDAMQQSQNDKTESESNVMDRVNVATLEEQDYTCGSTGKEHLKPGYIEVPKDGTNTTEPEAEPMIVSSALAGVSTETSLHASEIGDLDEHIYATLYGQCIGDAIGLLTEFMSKDNAHHYYGHKTELEYTDKIADRHRKRWEVGDWTDDSDQMILIMQSLIDEKGVVKPNDFARRLVKWMEEGLHELGDKGGIGIGQSTYITITREGFEANPHKSPKRKNCANFVLVRKSYADLGIAVLTEICDSTRDSFINLSTVDTKISKDVWEDSGRFLAPNGGVMRTSILGIHAWWDKDKVYGNAIDICKTTHFDPRCQASAVSVCIAISLMLQRGDRHYKNGEYIIQTIIEDVFLEASTCLQEETEKEELWRYLKYEDLSELKLDEVNSIGYTYKCLGAGFWALKQNDFRKALQEIAMSGGDADTNGAVAGALLGCKLRSRKCFPESWLKLRHMKWLDRLIKKYLVVLKEQQEEWNCVQKERSLLHKL